MKIPFLSQFFKSRDKPKNIISVRIFVLKENDGASTFTPGLSRILFGGRASIFSTASFPVGKASILQIYYSRTL